MTTRIEGAAQRKRYRMSHTDMQSNVMFCVSGKFRVTYGVKSSEYEMITLFFKLFDSKGGKNVLQKT